MGLQKSYFNRVLSAIDNAAEDSAIITSEDDRNSINKFGENFAIAADTREDIWDGGGTYDFPTSASITHIRAAADSVTTQGLMCQVQGLNANWNLVLQDVNLNGTNSATEVALPIPLIRIFRIKVNDAVVADQDIWVGGTGVSALTTKAMVISGNNQTLMAIFTIPAGYTGYMTGFYSTMTLATNKEPDGINVRLWAADRANGYEFQLKNSQGIQKGGDAINHKFNPYQSFGEKTDIKMNALAFGQVAQVSAGFDIILIKNK